jgi:hypothetical protein
MEGTGNCLFIPAPADTNKALPKALDVPLPYVLPHLQTSVVTRRKLPQPFNRSNP